MLGEGCVGSTGPSISSSIGKFPNLPRKASSAGQCPYRISPSSICQRSRQRKEGHYQNMLSLGPQPFQARHSWLAHRHLSPCARHRQRKHRHVTSFVVFLVFFYYSRDIQSFSFTVIVVQVNPPPSQADILSGRYLVYIPVAFQKTVRTDSTPLLSVACGDFFAFQPYTSSGNSSWRSP